ncbi:hypothetical protein PENTCL1PPCAC_4633 [Pristionchus entomophagus]|uniref:Bestrophin homolog n=1 Tax=Pristionchus entomophagus TaxID=358040 RepID=A0AAV5SHC7_9BILA|nr:hypothetical protein PENTCL1PPCAC_4633 [Pristionchus entomophagus]
MTVNYNLDVSNSSPFTLFKLLTRWKGSIWKAVWLEYLLWLCCYFIISAVWRYALTDDQRVNFVHCVNYITNGTKFLPLDFMLGFFVTHVVDRWQSMFKSIGIIDSVALMAQSHIVGSSIEARMLRRNIVRYCVLGQCIVFRDISMRVRKRFPTMDTVVTGRFMMQHELERFERVDDAYAKHFLPFQWAMSLANYARNKELIASDNRITALLNEIKEFRKEMTTLCNYDWVPLPIMYPQVVVLAIHAYFALALISRQFVDPNMIDLHFPIIDSLQFVFYIGWFKVAESLLNPMGEDDDDFECNWLLDRNLRIGLTIVDEGYDSTPDVMQDDFWGDANVKPLYTDGSSAGHNLEGSMANVILLNGKVKQVEMFPTQDQKAVDDDRRVLLDRNLNSKRVSIINLKRDSRDSLDSTSNVFDNLRRRLSRQAKHSTVSFGQFYNENGGGGGVAYNNDIEGVGSVPPSAPPTPRSGKRFSIYEIPQDESSRHSSLRKNHATGIKRQKSDDPYPMLAPRDHRMSSHRNRAFSNISEAAEENDVSRRSTMNAPHPHQIPEITIDDHSDENQSDAEDIATEHTHSDGRLFGNVAHDATPPPSIHYTMDEQNNVVEEDLG